MLLLALDISKRSTGWATWRIGDDRPASGTWSLGSEFTPAGGAFLNLFRELSALSLTCGEEEGRAAFDVIVYEEPLNLGPHAGFTNKDTLFLLTGLAATVDLWAEARRVRKLRHTNQSSWRRHFLGSIPRPRRKDEYGNRIKGAPIDWKGLATERCRQFGLKPKKHDEAEALGVLDYAIHLECVTPPWRIDHALLPPLGSGSARV